MPKDLRHSAKIVALRAALARTELPQHARVPLGHAGADLCLKGGLRRGVLHEIFAQGGHAAAASGFAATLSFRMAANRRVLWIQQDFSALQFGELAAPGLFELGLDPGRLLLLRVADANDALRAASDALSCAALGAVVMEIAGAPAALDLVASRRLTLASAQHGVTAFLLRLNAEADASTAETRWHVRAARAPLGAWGHPVFETDLVRNRQGRTGHWVMEWSCNDGLFRDAADRGAVVSAPFHRPAAAALEGANGLRRIA